LIDTYLDSDGAIKALYLYGLCWSHQGVVLIWTLMEPSRRCTYLDSDGAIKALYLFGLSDGAIKALY